MLNYFQTSLDLSKLVQTYLKLFKLISDDDDDFEGELGEDDMFR